MELKDIFFDIETIKHYAEELTILNNKIEEVLYDPENAPRELVIVLKSFLLEQFNEVVESPTWESFSYQVKDGTTLFEDKVVIDYRTDDDLLRKFNLSILEPSEVYSVNYLLDSKKKKYKFFDKAINAYSIPQLPAGSRIDLPYGLGMSPNDDRHVLYFLNKDLESVCRFFESHLLWLEGFTDCIDEDKNVDKLFAVSFHKESLKPIALKRYIYPKDIFLDNVVFDESEGGRDKS